MSSSTYLFDNAGVQTPSRFANTGPLYDPHTIDVLRVHGVAAGARCLEVGGGGGSIAEWLAEEVGPTGYVEVTDLDPRHLWSLETLRQPWVSVVQHDVGKDPLPEAAFDVVHSRLCIMHVPEREQVVSKLARALRPGGWLIIEDFDPHLISRGYATRNIEGAALHAKMCAAMGRLFASRGAAAGWARSLYGRFRNVGLVEVGMTTTMMIWPGGSHGALLDVANFSQVADEAVAAGLITAEEVEQVLQLLCDPEFEISSPLLCSAWGRRAG
jgi:SAM-dependent methyltransferase